MAEVKVAEDAGPDTLSGFDVIIDARSPSEFAEDHVPGAPVGGEAGPSAPGWSPGAFCFCSSVERITTTTRRLALRP